MKSISAATLPLATNVLARSSLAFGQLPGNSSVVARRVSGGSAGGPCAHAQGYKARRFFPSGAKRVLRPGLHRLGPVLVGLALASFAPVSGQETKDDIAWLVTYDGKTLPPQQGWTPVGELAVNARIEGGALKIVDDTAAALGAFRMSWTPDPAKEVVVEARVRVESVTAKKGKEGARGMGSFLYWPSLQGWPGSLVISDGRHQDGLVLHPEKIATFLDRVVMMDAKTEFHTYRLVIRGKDMSIDVDGKRRIQGEGAFWKPAESPEAYIQFGSNSKNLMGETYWASVRLGVRPARQKPEPPKLRITISAPWDVPSLPPGNPQTRPYGIIGKNTRPYLYDVGKDVLLMSVAQGPDAILEPYGVLKSTDEGRSWQPVRDMQYKSFAPLPMIRLPDDTIIGISRWTARYDREKGVFIGMTHRFDEKSGTFTMTENLIRVPENISLVAFDRHIFNVGNGELLAVVYGSAPMLLKSTDQGLNWTHFSTLSRAKRHEPAVVRFSETEMTAVLRTGGFQPFEQIWSNDGGKTWGSPVTLEEGSVDPDMVYMSNGVLACAYGRNGSNLMFSLDKGRTWGFHQVITDERGFNYMSIREVRPGRLLYVHDAPRLQALYVDVERLE
ncbi:MAG: exo-alpha-sialidase [Verrucomicrobia bacterium]|nr:exo-alpha-sialidase [Verrucomicrobiota bacterium]